MQCSKVPETLYCSFYTFRSRFSYRPYYLLQHLHVRSSTVVVLWKDNHYCKHCTSSALQYRITQHQVYSYTGTDKNVQCFINFHHHLHQSTCFQPESHLQCSFRHRLPQITIFPHCILLLWAAGIRIFHSQSTRKFWHQSVSIAIVSNTRKQAFVPQTDCQSVVPFFIRKKTLQ